MATIAPTEGTPYTNLNGVEYLTRVVVRLPDGTNSAAIQGSEEVDEAIKLVELEGGGYQIGGTTPTGDAIIIIPLNESWNYFIRKSVPDLIPVGNPGGFPTGNLGDRIIVNRSELKRTYVKGTLNQLQSDIINIKNMNDVQVSVRVFGPPYVIITPNLFYLKIGGEGTVTVDFNMSGVEALNEGTNVAELKFVVTAVTDDRLKL